MAKIVGSNEPSRSRGTVLRTSIPETPEFRRLLDSQHRERRLLVAVVRSHPRNFVLAMGSRLGVDVSFYVFTVYSLSYAQTTLGVPKNTGLVGLLIGATLGTYMVVMATISIVCALLARNVGSLSATDSTKVTLPADD